MKKVIVTLSFLFVGYTCTFAQKYLTRTGKISFTATSPSSPEKIEAVNNEVANILDAKTGELIFQVPVKSFKFERELMQEHFNENYLESDKFPKAEFKGKIINLAEVNFSTNGTYPTKVIGKLTIHGVTNEINVPGIIEVKGKDVVLKTKFSIKLKEYKIDVPALVADKVAKDAMIILESILVQK